MSDITINLPLPTAQAVLAAIFWPVTLALICAALYGLIRSRGTARFVFAAIAALLVADWAVGSYLLK